MTNFTQIVIALLPVIYSILIPVFHSSIDAIAVADWPVFLRLAIIILRTSLALGAVTCSLLLINDLLRVLSGRSINPAIYPEKLIIRGILLVLCASMSALVMIFEDIITFIISGS